MPPKGSKKSVKAAETDVPFPSSASSSSLPPGHTFGNRWKLGSKLGAGACAEVFSAQCTVTPNPVPYEVVIKIIPLGTGKGKVCSACVSHVYS